MSDFSKKVPLGRTGLMVSRLGIGSSYGISEKACLKAFDAGVNYFFWGSLRTSEMGRAIQAIGPGSREDLVVVLECYARHPKLMEKSVDTGLDRLGIEQADILLLGWHDRPPGMAIMEKAEELREKGRFGFLGISGHQRPVFQDYIRDGCYDVFHIRYNAAHPGAETDIFPHLPESFSPGIVSFTNTRWGDLLKEKNMPAGIVPPQASDCYRFVLSNPHVHTAVCGPKNDQEMDDALAILKSGPLDSDEMVRMRRIGNHVHGVRSLMSRFS